uniref:Uncharacterized protein n=1 Tax=Arundo donax TaxID=35708 RepID=A0A0A9HX30_ARUDO
MNPVVRYFRATREQHMIFLHKEHCVCFYFVTYVCNMNDTLSCNTSDGIKMINTIVWLIMFCCTTDIEGQAWRSGKSLHLCQEVLGSKHPLCIAHCRGKACLL